MAFKLHYLADLLANVDQANEYSKNQITHFNYNSYKDNYSLQMNPTGKPILRFDTEELNEVFNKITPTFITADALTIEVHYKTLSSEKAHNLLDIIYNFNQLATFSIKIKPLTDNFLLIIQGENQ